MPLDFYRKNKLPIGSSLFCHRLFGKYQDGGLFISNLSKYGRHKRTEYYILTPGSNVLVFTIHCTLYCVHCTVYSYSVQYTRYSVHA